MTYLAVETSAWSTPIELFTFAREGSAWYMTSHDQDVVRNGITYRAALLARESFKQSEESEQIVTTIRLSGRTALGQELLFYGLNNRTGPMYVRLALTMITDTEVWPVFMGEVSDLLRTETHAELTVQSVQKLLQRPLLRVIGGAQCNHALYDTGCTVNMEDYKSLTTVQAVNGRSITVAPLASESVYDALHGGSYAGGIVQYNHQKWFVEWNLATSFHLMEPMDVNMIGVQVAVYKGCTRLYDVCKNRFNNVRNFGGFNRWPLSSAFDDAT